MNLNVVSFLYAFRLNSFCFCWLLGYFLPNSMSHSFLDSFVPCIDKSSSVCLSSFLLVILWSESGRTKKENSICRDCQVFNKLIDFLLGFHYLSLLLLLELRHSGQPPYLLGWSVVQMGRAKVSLLEICQSIGQQFMYLSCITHSSPSTIPTSNKSLQISRNWTITSSMMLMAWGESGQKVEKFSTIIFSQPNEVMCEALDL